MSQHGQALSLQESWEIDWYVCRASEHDVEAGVAKAVGDEFWRAPLSIGPLYADRNHWAGDHIACDKEDAYLVAASPKMLSALRAILDEARAAGSGEMVIPCHVWGQVGLAVHEALKGPDTD